MEKTFIALLLLIQKITGKIRYLFYTAMSYLEKKKLGFCGKGVIVKYPVKLNDKIFLGDFVKIYGGARFIIGPVGEKIVMKKRVVASQGLTIITGKHGHEVGLWSHDVMCLHLKDKGSTVVVEDDVSIGANVTLLPGVTIGRGSQIGACSVVTKDVPPYAIVAGNPAKTIRFIFTPEEILKHESLLYNENERFPIDEIRRIQSKFLKTSDL